MFDECNERERFEHERMIVRRHLSMDAIVEHLFTDRSLEGRHVADRRIEHASGDHQGGELDDEVVVRRGIGGQVALHKRGMLEDHFRAVGRWGGPRQRCDGDERMDPDGCLHRRSGRFTDHGLLEPGAESSILIRNGCNRDPVVPPLELPREARIVEPARKGDAADAENIAFAAQDAVRSCPVSGEPVRNVGTRPAHEPGRKVYTPIERRRDQTARPVRDFRHGHRAQASPIPARRMHQIAIAAPTASASVTAMAARLELRISSSAIGGAAALVTIAMKRVSSSR